MKVNYDFEPKKAYKKGNVFLYVIISLIGVIYPITLETYVIATTLVLSVKTFLKASIVILPKLSNSILILGITSILLSGLNIYNNIPIIKPTIITIIIFNITSFVW